MAVSKDRQRGTWQFVVRVTTADGSRKRSRLLDRCLRDFDRHHRYMISAGLSVPEVPDEWAERMMLLRVPEDDR
jgi:hypothetical protein